MPWTPFRPIMKGRLELGEFRWVRSWERMKGRQIDRGVSSLEGLLLVDMALVAILVKQAGSLR